MKHVKKSLFISTVLMVALMVVALSTATFAWYTAQSSATVTDTTITSATSSSASLVIDEEAAQSNMATNTSITITMNDNIKPMIINNTAAPVVGTTTYDKFIAVDKIDPDGSEGEQVAPLTGGFYTFNVKNGTPVKYSGATSEATPAKIATVKGSSAEAQDNNYFYVTNVGGVATGIEATVNFDTAEENNKFLRVAIFVDDKYQGTWANGSYLTVEYADYAHATSATVADGLNVITHSSYSATASGTGIKVASSVASMTAIKVQIVAWFEGSLQQNSNAGTATTFSISFNAVAVA